MVRYLIDQILTIEKNFDSATTTEERIEASLGIGRALFDFIDMLEIEIRAMLPLKNAVRSSRVIGRGKDYEERWVDQPSEKLLYMSESIRPIVDDYMTNRLTQAEFNTRMAAEQAFNNPVPLDLLVVMVKDYMDSRVSVIEKMPVSGPPAQPATDYAEFTEVSARVRSAPDPLKQALAMVRLCGDVDSIMLAYRSNLYKGNQKSILHMLIDRLAYIDKSVTKWVDVYYGGPLPSKLSPAYFKYMTFFLYESTDIHDLYFKEAENQKVSKSSNSVLMEPIDRPMGGSDSFDPLTTADRYAAIVAQIALPARFMGIEKKPYDFEFLVSPRKYRAPVKQRREDNVYEVMFRETAPGQYRTVMTTRDPGLVEAMSHRFRFLYRMPPLERTTFAAVRNLFAGMLLGLEPTNSGMAAMKKLEPYLPADARPEYKIFLAFVFDLLMPHPEIYQEFTKELLTLLYVHDEQNPLDSRALQAIHAPEAVEFYREMFTDQLSDHRDAIRKLIEKRPTDRALRGDLEQADAEDQRIRNLNAAEIVSLALTQHTDPVDLLVEFLFPVTGEPLNRYIDGIIKANRQKVIQNLLTPGNVIIDKNTGERTFRPLVLFMWIQHISNHMKKHGIHTMDDIAKTKQRREVLWQGKAEMRQYAYSKEAEEFRSGIGIAPIPPFEYPATSRGQKFMRIIRDKYRLSNGRATITDFQVMMLIINNNLYDLDLGTFENPNEQNLTRLSNRLLYVGGNPPAINMDNIKILAALMDDRFTPLDLADAATKNSLQTVNQRLMDELAKTDSSLTHEERSQEAIDRLRAYGIDLQEFIENAEQLLNVRNQEVEETLDEDLDSDDDQEAFAEPRPEKKFTKEYMDRLNARLQDQKLTRRQKFKIVSEAMAEIERLAPTEALQQIRQEEEARRDRFIENLYTQHFKGEQ